jgi:predicted  nucleic acid-binding Zn-ribbon protein
VASRTPVTLQSDRPAAKQTRAAASLADYPALAAEWHPTLNGDLVPEQTPPGSKRKAWWVCSKCQHVWPARVSSRTSTRGHGCPACGRRAAGKARSTPKPGESLAEKFPEIAAEWHPTRNEDLTPSDVGYASNKRVFWQCRVCRHEWQRQVSGRTQRRTSCPECARTAKAVPKAGNSLAERCPQLAAEWHPTRNGDLTPSEVSFSKKEKAWWQCSGCGHEWPAVIGNRVRWPGCPNCGRNGRRRRTRDDLAAASDGDRQKPARKRAPVKAPAPGRSFAERFPEIAAEWHPTLNGELTPNQVGYASNRPASWLCPTCGHEWEAIIQSRGKGAGCPECGRRRSGRANAKPKPGRSLAELFPAIAAEWHTELNAPLTPEQVAAKSRRPVWWRCSACEHVWEAAIYSRANGHGCRACATRELAVIFSAPKPGQSLAERDPELAAQWHPSRNGSVKPSNVTANSGQTVWWLCDRRHEWPAMINNRSKARGCPQCTLWGTSVEEIRLRHELLAAGVPIDANHEVVHAESGKVLQCDMLCSAWNLVIEFDGNRFHKLPANMEKDERKTRMLAEAGWTVVRVREDLPTIGEHDVWVPLLSNETTRAKETLKKLRSLGLKAAEHDAYLKTDKPWGSDAAATYIKRRRIDKSLAALYPELAAQWHPEKTACGHPPT